MWVAEVCADGELVVEEIVLGEFGAVVEGDGSAQACVEGSKPVEQLVCGVLRGLAGLPCQHGEPGLPLVADEESLAWGGEHHEVGFPVAEGGAAFDGGRAQIDGHTALYEVVGRARASAPRASPGSAVGQVVAPGAMVGAADLGVDEAVDALVADRYGGILLAQPAGDRLGRPAELELAEDEPAQPGIALRREPVHRRARACSWA